MGDNRGGEGWSAWGAGLLSRLSHAQMFGAAEVGVRGREQGSREGQRHHLVRGKGGMREEKRWDGKAAAVVTRGRGGREGGDADGRGRQIS